MSTHPKATATKRSRERAKAEKRKEKIQRREERKKVKETDIPVEDGLDPDLAGIMPGPQPPLY
jgi:hypothetical protein